MLIRLLTITSVLFFSACGGGSSSSSAPSQISGMWNGLMTQASGIRCSDGSYIGVGVGTSTRELSIEIKGGDLIGETASLILDECFYSGERIETSQIIFSTDESNCAPELSLTDINNNKAELYINAGEAKSDFDEIVCFVNEVGEVQRID
jgi:hypothetical protein